MTLRLRCLTLAMTLFAITWAALAGPQNGIPRYAPDHQGKYMQDWLLCGPFPNPLDPDNLGHTRHLPGFYKDYLQALGGETNLQVQAGQVVQMESGSTTWTLHQSPDIIIDLDKAVTTEDNVLAYAVAEVEMTEPGRWVLALGSNNGIRAWVNGKEVFDDPTIPSLTLDGSKAPAYFEKGGNQVLLKIEEGRGLWQFAARLLPFDPADYYEQEDFQVKTYPEKGVVIEAKSKPDAMPFRSARFTLALREKPEEPLGTQEWEGQAWFPLPIDMDAYKEYRLTIYRTYENGHEQERHVFFNTGYKPRYSLFDSGNTVYRIVLSPEASETEKWAAEELSRILEEMSGAEFPIVKDDLQHTFYEIVVGYNQMARRLLPPEAKPLADEDEGFHIRNNEGSIIIWGGRNRGTMYGVFRFLEKYLGCRWYTPGEACIPRRDSWTFSGVHLSESPGVRFRDVDYFTAYDGIRGALGRINSQRFMRGHKPGGMERFWFEHSFQFLVPPAEFFDSHPEYFSLVDGERMKDHSQLCLTNPEILPIAVERLKKLIRQEPHYRVYNVAQNDNQNYCQCPNCTALAEKEGSQQAPILRFVNQVAAEIEKEFPEKFIGTFAYQYSRKPCKNLRPRDNVMIVLCNIECDFSHPLTHPNNASFVEDIEGWAAITPNVFIWDYVVNYRHFLIPHPNFHVLQPNIQFLRDHNVIGILEQAAYLSPGTEFAELRSWLLAHLLWNPDLDFRDKVEDFIFGYYGRSGPYMLQYFDLIGEMADEDSYITFATDLSNPVYTRTFLEKGKALFDRAEAVADNEEIFHRVRKERMGLMYMEMLWDPLGAEKQGLPEQLQAIARREGLKFSSEGFRLKQFMDVYRRRKAELE